MLGKSKSLTTCPAWQVSSENYVGACLDYIPVYVYSLCFIRHVREVNGSVEASHKVELTSDYLSFIISLIIGRLYFSIG